MYTLSLWASRNKWQARIIIIAASIILYLGAWFGGSLMASYETYWSSSWTSTFLITGLCCMVLYPRRNSKAHYSYTYRKALDTILTFSSVMLLFCFSNQQESSHRTASFQPPFANVTHAAYHNTPVKPAIKQQKQLLRKYIRTVKAYMDKASRKQNTGLVILVVLLGIGLGMIVAMLSCSIACNGSGVAAALVMALGVTGIFFLCRSLIRGITTKPKKATPKTSAEPSL